MKELCFAIVLGVLCSCGGPKPFQQSNETSATNTANDEVIADPNSDVELKGSDGSEIEGAGLAIPAGSLKSSSKIKMQVGSSLVSTGLGSQLAVGVDTSFTAKGSAALVLPEEKLNPSTPLAMSLPISSTSLNGLEEEFIIIFKAIKYGTKEQVLLGIIPSSELNIKNNIAVFKISYFGSYQLATSSKSFAKRISVIDTSPILSKQESQDLGRLTLKKPTITVATNRSISANTSSAKSTLVRCTAIFDRDKKRPWDSQTELSKKSTHSISALVATAHQVYAIFDCHDKNGRNALSEWSSVADVPAEETTTVATSPAALSSFTASAAKARHSVKLILVYPAVTTDYQTVRIYSAAGVSAPSCGSGTLVTTITSSFSETTTLYDQAGQGVYSYRVCISSSNGTLTSSNTQQSIVTSDDYLAFLTSSTYTGDFNTAFNGQTFSNGLEGADYRCQYHANLAGLGGQWKAMLSSTTSAASSRIVPSSSRVVLTDASSTVYLDMISTNFWTQHASAHASCSTATQFSTVAFQYDEAGNNIGGSNYWSGSALTGSHATNKVCNDWIDGTSSFQGARGNTGCSSQYWLNYNIEFCNIANRLYCVSID